MMGFRGFLAMVGGCAAILSAHAQPPMERERPSPGRWADAAYRWHYNPANRPAWLGDAQALALLQEAAAKWRECGVSMEFLGQTQIAPATIDGVNVVGWRSQMPPQMRGVTVGRAREGRLLERDIVFAADRAEFERHPELLRKVLVHEFGHAIGLTHSARCDEVMTLAADCPGQDPARLPLAPTARDIERCRALYAGSRP